MKNKFTKDELKAKDYLDRLRPARLNVLSKKAKLEEVETLALPGAMNYDKIRVQSSPGNPQEKIYILIEEASEEYRQAVKSYDRIYQEVSGLIEEVAADDRELGSLLTLRYICRCSCEETAVRLSFSESTFFRRYKEAHTRAAAYLT